MNCFTHHNCAGNQLLCNLGLLCNKVFNYSSSYSTAAVSFFLFLSTFFLGVDSRM